MKTQKFIFNQIKLLLILLIFILTNSTQAQIKDHYFLLKEAKGDLNKDNIIDKVIVFNDTINPESVYKVQIYFGDSNGEYNLFLESDNAITARFSGAKNYLDRFSGDLFNQIKIKNGILIFETDLTRGYYENKYRFQNNTFELIGYSSSEADGRGGFIINDFNLSTGVIIEKTGSSDSNKDKIKKFNIKISPLPTILEEFDVQKDVLNRFFFSGNHFNTKGKNITRTMN